MSAWPLTERRKKRQQMRGFVEIISAALVVAAFGPLLLSHASKALWPVIRPLHIESITETEDGVRIAGHAVKLRECSFVELHWYLGRKDGLKVPVSVSFEDPPQLRLTGETHWSGILVGLSADQVVNNSHAIVEHSCHGPLVKNIFTDWYTGDGADAGLVYQKRG